MKKDINYYRAIHGTLCAQDESSARLMSVQRNLAEELRSSAHYVNALRNGYSQGFVITTSETPYKATIQAMPGEEIYPGDEIVYQGSHWIVMTVKSVVEVQRTGTMWECNYLFRWQNGSTSVIEQWGVLDSGVFSTTLAGGVSLPYPDKQFKLYMPRTDCTERLYVDKRLAVGTGYNSDGEKILRVFTITGMDPVGESYECGGHLLSIDLRAGTYNASTDNIQLGICDYISDVPGETIPDSPVLQYPEIIGTPTVRLGRSRTLRVEYPGEEGVPVWSLSPCMDGIILESDGTSAIIQASKNEDLVGATFIVIVDDASGKYAGASMKVEVIDLG